MPNEDIDKFFNKLPADFIEPITEPPPRSERQLYSILSAKHCMNLIKRQEIEFKYIIKNGNARTILPDDTVFSDYPIFTGDSESINRWREMAPDLTLPSADRKKLTLVQCKVDSQFTFSNSPPDGQISRHI